METFAFMLYEEFRGLYALSTTSPSSHNVPEFPTSPSSNVPEFYNVPEFSSSNEVIFWG